MGFLKSLFTFLGLGIGLIALAVTVMANIAPQQSQNIQSSQSCKKVIMYSLTTCGACKIKKQVLAHANIPLTVYETDQNPEQNRILWEKAKAAGWSKFGAPVLEVNGKLFRSTVTVDELKANLC